MIINFCFFYVLQNHAFGKVQYSIVGSNNAMSIFQVGKDTGVISLKQAVYNVPATSYTVRFKSLWNSFDFIHFDVFFYFVIGIFRS